MTSATIPVSKPAFQPLVPVGSLDAYVNWAHSIPILSAEDEQKLTARLYQEGDLDAAKELVLSHLRFVVYVSKSFQGYGLPQADIIQEGNIGLMKAIKRFDPSVGVRLVSFAVYWIKSEIQEYILKNWRIVKIATTKAQRTLFLCFFFSFTYLYMFYIISHLSTSLYFTCCFYSFLFLVIPSTPPPSCACVVAVQDAVVLLPLHLSMV